MKKEESKPLDGVKDTHQPENVQLTGADLFQFLVEGPDKRIKHKKTEEELEKQFQKLALLGAKQSSIDAAMKLVLFTAKEYKVTFPQIFYKEIFRLNGWNVNTTKIYRKPWKVAKYTMEVIYGRFTKEIVDEIQLKNPYIIPGIRRYKHFQYLNEIGQQELERFINEAVEVMSQSTTWYDFRIKMFDTHQLPYQTSLFN